MNPVETRFSTALQEFRLTFSGATFHRLCDFITLLLDANQRVNLTAITEYEEALYKHILDSLLVTKLSFWENTTEILDVGSGAGVPAIPLALVFPDKVFVTLEATQKKVAFQQQIVQDLSVKNLTPIWGRAEELGQKAAYRERFDLVLARAVAAVNVLAELTIPFAKLPKGVICYYKGTDYKREIQSGQYAVNKLGGRVSEIIEFDLPLSYGSRSLIVINKHQPTPPEFPRKNGIPQKKPLTPCSPEL
jgi:16S rRNA (guanine527-N7)-methyltransferase